MKRFILILLLIIGILPLLSAPTWAEPTKMIINNVIVEPGAVEDLVRQAVRDIYGLSDIELKMKNKDGSQAEVKEDIYFYGGHSVIPRPNITFRDGNYIYKITFENGKVISFEQFRAP